MKQIWKYELDLVESQRIPMPKGAKPLSVGAQGKTPVMWAEVDPDSPSELVAVKIVATGQPITNEISAMNFVGTFQIGGFVGHVFTP